MPKRKYKKRRKQRPIIKITAEQLDLWGFVIGAFAAAIDVAVLIVLILWWGSEGLH